MNADLIKRLFRGIFSEDIVSLKMLANLIINEERRLGHDKLANTLEHISVTEKTRFIAKDSNGHGGFASLPTTKRDHLQLVSCIPRENLKHHRILREDVEARLISVENEFFAQDRLGKYNLIPKKKILLHGAPGCGKTLTAERLAWNLGLPLLKVRFDALLSSYFGESASNLRAVFDCTLRAPVVLLLDECDFIARSRVTTQDVGEVPRIVNMLLTLLDEYNSPGLVIATTNLKIQLDEALFRRFDEVIELPMPGIVEREKVLRMTLSAIPFDKEINLHEIAQKLDNCSYANIVLIAQKAAKYSVLAGHKKVKTEFFEQSISESIKY